jgi:hypothetical protein
MMVDPQQMREETGCGLLLLVLIVLSALVYLFELLF